MKKFLLFAVVVALFSTVFVSCSKSNDDNDNTTSTPIATLLASGTWRVESYNDRGTNETGNYTGYTFTFEGLNYSAAILASVVTNGTWTTSNDGNVERVQLDYGTTPPLDELKGDWIVSAKSETQVLLSATDGSGTLIKQLAIAKIIR